MAAEAAEPVEDAVTEDVVANLDDEVIDTEPEAEVDEPAVEEVEAPSDEGPAYCQVSHLTQADVLKGPFTACCTAGAQCLSRFCLEGSHFGRTDRTSRCQNACVRDVEAVVGACCADDADCTSGFCSYGVCASNCPENDLLLMNRNLGACCDDGSQCDSGSCAPDQHLCVRGAAPITVDVEEEEEEEVEVVDEEEQVEEEEAAIEETAEDDEEETEDVDEEDDTSADEAEINDEDAEAEEELTEMEELEDVDEEDTDVATLTVEETSKEEGSGTFLPEEAGNPTYALYWRLAIVVAGLLLVGIITLIISCGCGRRPKEQPKEDPDRRSAYVYRAADDEIVKVNQMLHE